MERTIIVGDVHGCLDELRDLLIACGWKTGERLVLAGDLVAKGPDSQGVVQLARESRALAVLGNHDAHVLRTRAETGLKLRPGHQVVVESLTEPDWHYLEAMPLFLRLGRDNSGQEFAVVHAGAVPGVLLDQQQREHLITMRSIRSDGSTSKRIEGTPWAAAWQGPEHLVFGHDAVRGLQQQHWATGLDTGCVYGQRLSALILPGRQIVSIPARKAYVTS